MAEIPFAGTNGNGTRPGRRPAARPAVPGPRAQRAPADDLTHGRGTGYVVLSHLLAGMVAYGAIGWAVGRAIHIAVLFPVGMLVGLGISMALVIHRYGRARTAAPAPGTLRPEAGTAAHQRAAAGRTPARGADQ